MGGGSDGRGHRDDRGRTHASRGRSIERLRHGGAYEGAGRRALQRIFGRRPESGGLPAVLAEVVENPGDEDYLSALRLAIRKTLQAGDAELLADIRDIIAAAQPDATVAQTITAGRDAYAAGRDMTITRKAKYAVDASGARGIQIGDGNFQRNDFGAK
jgi:hypothetical protein